MLDPKRIGLIHVAKATLKLAEEDYRAILLRLGQVESAKHLDELGFHNLMREFERLGFKSTWRKKTGGHRPGMATAAQMQLMTTLWRTYRGEDDETGFRQWLERFHHVSDARFVTVEKANAVMTALKMMARRKRVA